MKEVCWWCSKEVRTDDHTPSNGYIIVDKRIFHFIC